MTPPCFSSCAAERTKTNGRPRLGTAVLCVRIFVWLFFFADIQADDAGYDGGTRQYLACHAGIGPDGRVVDEPGGTGAERQDAHKRRAAAAVGKGGNGFGNAAQQTARPFPGKGDHEKDDRTENIAHDECVFSFLHHVGKGHIPHTAEQVHRRAGIGAEQNVLYGKQQLVRRAERHQRVMPFALERADGREDAENADPFLEHEKPVDCHTEKIHGPTPCHADVCMIQ